MVSFHRCIPPSTRVQAFTSTVPTAGKSPSDKWWKQTQAKFIYKCLFMILSNTHVVKECPQSFVILTIQGKQFVVYTSSILHILVCWILIWVLFCEMRSSRWTALHWAAVPRLLNHRLLHNWHKLLSSGTTLLGYPLRFIEKKKYIISKKVNSWMKDVSCCSHWTSNPVSLSPAWRSFCFSLQTDSAMMSRGIHIGTTHAAFDAPARS